MTTSETDTSTNDVHPDKAPVPIEERLRNRVSMLTQLLIVAGLVVTVQFGIMVKVLIDSAK